MKKVNRILTYLLLLMVFSPALVYTKVTSKVVKNSDGTLAKVFSRGSKEIAREIRSRDGKIIKTNHG